MPFDAPKFFRESDALLRDAVRGLGTIHDDDLPLNTSALTPCSLRRHFFVAGLQNLERRANAIKSLIDSCGLFTPDNLVSRPDLARATGHPPEPITLFAAARLVKTIRKLTETEQFRKHPALLVENEPVTLGEDCIVPSVYLPVMPALEQVRFTLGFTREGVSGFLFPHSNCPTNTMRVLEDGHGQQEYRVTLLTAMHIYKFYAGCYERAQIQIVEFDKLFTTDPSAGPKKGEQTDALPVSWGNALVKSDLSVSKSFRLSGPFVPPSDSAPKIVPKPKAQKRPMEQPKA